MRNDLVQLSLDETNHLKLGDGERTHHCWARIPSGCQTGMTETNTPDEWFLVDKTRQNKNSCENDEANILNRRCSFSRASGPTCPAGLRPVTKLECEQKLSPTVDDLDDYINGCFTKSSANDDVPYWNDGNEDNDPANGWRYCIKDDAETVWASRPSLLDYDVSNGVSVPYDHDVRAVLDNDLKTFWRPNLENWGANPSGGWPLVFNLWRPTTLAKVEVVSRFDYLPSEGSMKSLRRERYTRHVVRTAKL